MSSLYIKEINKTYRWGRQTNDSLNLYFFHKNSGEI